MNREEIFREVFKSISFPFEALDLELLSKAITNNQQPSSHIAIPLMGDEDKQDAFKGAFRGLFANIEPPEKILSILKNSQILNHKGNLSDTEIKCMMEVCPNPFKVYEQSGLFVYEEGSYWPIAYNTLICQLKNVVYLFKVLIEERKKELPAESVQPIILSEYPRNLPTSIHYAFASLGSWLGGAANFQFSSYYATKPQIDNPQTNIKYAQMMGYTAYEGKMLTDSGMMCIPARLMLPLIEMQGSKECFGSISINEINIANLPNQSTLDEIIKLDPQYPGIILDKNYRTPFFARKLTNYAIYGAKETLRDHYTEFYENNIKSDLVRCKHYCYPIIDVSSILEMEDIVSQIPSRGSGEIFYRGQNKCYMIQRNSKVRELLFGDSNITEPSLITSACRWNYDYDDLHFKLKYFFGQEYLYAHKQSELEFQDKNTLWNKISIDPLCEYDYAIMALAQHYGLPTHGLDITTDLNVATWFATNVFRNDSGRSSYSKMTQWSEDKKDWPVVFVFQPITHTIMPSLHDCSELTKLGVKALRPERQSAKLFLGGHSDHQNRLAEALVCVFRLSPEIYKTNLDFDYLFPNPQEDNAYQDILNLCDDVSFGDSVKQYINRFY